MAQTRVTTLELKNDYRFSVSRVASWTPGAGIANKVPFDTIEYDPLGMFTIGTSYQLTIPVTGLYFLNATATASGSTSTTTFVTLYKNGNEMRRGNRDGNNNNNNYGITTQEWLTAGDIIDVRLYVTGGNIESGAVNNYFQGHLISV